MADFRRIRALVHSYGDLFGDVTDLVDKELRLARSELKQGSANLTQAVVLFIAAGMIALFALLLLLVGIVHLIASSSLALQWSYMLVALALLIIAGGSVYLARGKVSAENLIPKRTFAQLGKTTRVLKDQFR